MECLRKSKDSEAKLEKWATNSQSPKAFTDSIMEQDSRWKSFVIWLCVLAAKEVLANDLMAEQFLRQGILAPLVKPLDRKK